VTLLETLPEPWDADAAYDAFEAYWTGRGLSLYPAQQEALLEIVSGSNLILSTPTGTGKSLVAIGAHFAAMGQGRRSFYTAPIKALVSEKFFALVDIFGAENVGMITGDSSVNSDAPIICCTAEILANLALRGGEDTEVDLVVMDEFHFYGDPDRGWAWQVPLLTLPHVQFVLMSATLGDVTAIADDLSIRTGRETATVTGVERPVPLEYRYALTPVHETVEQLLEAREAPVYVVHFSQKDALERAQALTSAKIATREQRDAIADAIGDFRFTTRFGQTLSRLIRAGIGVHHAGMLPKYRRLVEQLAQQGLLRVICGTDTLGVGINVPIRTVLLTALTKFDGTRMRQLTAREFHQIAGRAGRAGYDTAGTVVCQAPEHDAENARALAKAGDDPKKLKKVVRKRAPEGFVSWGEPSFQKLIAAEPETMQSQMRVSSAMLLNVIARGGDVYAHMHDLIFGSQDPWRRQLALARQALGIAKTLRAAGVIERVAVQWPLDRSEASDALRPTGHYTYAVTVDLQANFALNQPLSPFALAVIELLDPASATYALDVVSIIEATLDDPRPILSQQQYKARGEAVAAMKAEGIEYEERMELLEEVTWPKPLDELLSATFEQYVATQPWVAEFALSPKTVVRDLYERAMTFADFTQYYDIARSEGLVLRYLSDAYRAIRQTVPDEAKDESLLDIIEWLGELVRQVDSSLLDEWEQLTHPIGDDGKPVAPPPPPSVIANPRAFRVLVRNAMFRRVQLFALDDLDSLTALDPDIDWEAALDGYFDEYDTLSTDADARSSAYLTLDEGALQWRATQVLADPAGDHDWRLEASVDLEASAEAGEAVLTVTRVGTVG
jgi:superfamily II RNA helicase